MIAGVLVSSGCLCGPSFRLTGLAISFGMAGVVGLFGGLAVVARKHPRSAITSAALLEGIVIILMLQPTIQPPLIAWYAQVIVYALVCPGTVFAFHS